MNSLSDRIDDTFRQLSYVICEYRSTKKVQMGGADDRHRIERNGSPSLQTKV